MINENVLKGQWNTIRGALQKKWGQLTDDDLNKIQGDVKSLEALMQKRLGHSREEVHEELDAFLQPYNKSKNEH